MNATLSSLIIYLLAFFPAVGWVIVYRYLDNRDPEPLKATSFGLLMGILSTFPVFLLQIFFTQYPNFDLVSLLQQSIENPVLFSTFFLIFVAFIEELVKAGAFLYVIRKYERSFNQVIDGIVYAAFIGIGFAFAENIYYFTRAVDVFQFSGNFLAVFSIRSFGTMLAHTLFTGLFGFYFAKAYFSPFLDKTSTKEPFWPHFGKNLKQAVRLHATFFHLLPVRVGQKGSLKRNVVILEGFLMAVLVHFIYNGLIKLELFGRHWTFLIVPFLFVAAWYTWSRFFIPLYSRIIDFIRIRKGLYKARIH